ncbi:hypothetical protein [Pseudomonas sp. NBRC 111118]|uniref:hypothetical protein n=1 Tax=Pseudomonas sp. NBRC 111118 TaxID=1661033 RepID=UPI0006D40454|nr:hypothetical protein [Pseudomonas sp. NBRC 111118]
MNKRELNTSNKEIIYAKKRFWLENEKDAFNTSLSDYFGIEAVTVKKASNHLNREKAFLDKELKQLVTDAESANFIRSFIIKKEIDQLTKTRELIANSLSKLTGFHPYELVIINNEESGNGTPYAIESYADFMDKLTNVYKVKEVDAGEYELLLNPEQEDLDRKERLDVRYDEKINMICIMQTFLQMMLLYYFLDGYRPTPETSNMFSISILLLIPFWYLIQPWIVRKIFKKQA